MFDLSVHSDGESGEHGKISKDPGIKSESFNQSLINCTPILTGMSREMRTQMNAIVAFTFLLNNKEYCDEDREEFSNEIYNSCEQIISMFVNFA